VIEEHSAYRQYFHTPLICLFPLIVSKQIGQLFASRTEIAIMRCIILKIFIVYNPNALFCDFSVQEYNTRCSVVRSVQSVFRCNILYRQLPQGVQTSNISFAARAIGSSWCKSFALVCDVMGDDNLCFCIHSDLHVVAHIVAMFSRGHQPTVGIGQRDLRLTGVHQRFLQFFQLCFVFLKMHDMLT